MEALYSPRTQTFALLPRYSPSSSSSLSSSTSSSSVCLSPSKIQSIRNEFIGCGHKLRLRSRRRCKRLRYHATRIPSLRLVACLSPLPIVAVVVAMTVSAVAVVYSSFYFPKQKKNSDDQVAPTPAAGYSQVGRDTTKQGFNSPVDVEHLHFDILKEVGDSSSKDNYTVPKLSYLNPSPLPQDTLSVQHADLPDSNFSDLGANASALYSTSEDSGPSFPLASPEQDAVLPLAHYKEKPELVNCGTEADLSPQHLASMTEMMASVSVLLDTTPVKDQDHAESTHVHDACQFPEIHLDLESPASVVDVKDCGVVLVDTASGKGNTHEETNCEHSDSRCVESDLGLGSSIPIFLMKDAVSVPVDASTRKNKKSKETNHEHDEYQLQATDLNLLSPTLKDEVNSAKSVFVDSSPVMSNNHDDANSEHDDCQLQATVSDERTRSRREELHLFYEDIPSLDYPEVLRKVSGLSSKVSLLDNNNGPIIARNSAAKMLREEHSQTAGVKGHMPVASQAGGSFHERKGLWKGKGSIGSDTRDSSFQYGNPKFSVVPDAHKILVNGKHNTSRLMSFYNRFLKTGRLNECVELLENMSGQDILDMSKIYHAKFFDLCRNQKAVKEAFRFAKLIPNPTLSTFNMLMSVCSSAHDSEGAFEVWRLVQDAGFKVDCKLYTTLISTCAKSGKVDTMFEVFHEMINCGVEPNVHTYGALIDGCARAGQVAKAFGAYGILRTKNVKPDRVVFNALITACGQSGAVERAFDVLAEMRAESHPIDPDHITIGALIRACTSAGQVHRVKKVYEMIDKYNIKGTPELYTIAINSCSQTGGWEFACNIYDDMIKKGVVPDEMVFSALIDVAGHAGNLDAAFEVLQNARAQGLSPGNISYSSLMGACSNTQNWEKALELFEQIKALNLTPTVSTVNALITSLCEADQMQKALDVLSEMKTLGLCPNDVTYSILLVASEKIDDLEVGLSVFAQAKEDGVPFSLIMCKCLTRMCAWRHEKALTLGEPVLSFKSGRPQIDSKWTSLALTIYRETIGSGLIPSAEMLSQVLRCLKLPQDVSLKKRLIENLGINSERSRSANLFSLMDGFGEYDPRAFSLFEEAASLGIVPGVSFQESTIVIDTGGVNIQIAEVYIMTVLKGLKHRLAAGAKSPSISISLPVETTEISCPKGDKTINVSGRVSQAVGALFRRLRLPYHGNESSGKIRISGLAVKRWFQPKLVPSFSGKQAQLGLSQLRLAKGITHQQRNIRTGNLSLD